MANNQGGSYKIIGGEKVLVHRTDAGKQVVARAPAKARPSQATAKPGTAKQVNKQTGAKS